MLVGAASPGETTVTSPDAPDAPGTWPAGASAAPVEGRTTGPGRDLPRSARWPAVLGSAAVVALVATAIVVTNPARHAIVVGDGLSVTSGPGPTDEPERRWSSATTVTDPLPPVIAAETVVVAGRQGDETAVVGIDRSSGRQLWTTRTGVGEPVSLTVADGDVTVVTSGGETAETRVTRLDGRTGAGEWRADVAVPGRATRTSALPDGATVVSTVDDIGRTRTVVAAADGEVVLDEPAGPAAASAEAIAVLDGRVVRTLDTNGTPVASFGVGVRPVIALAVVGGRAVVGQEQEVRAFDVTTGEEVWSVEAGATIAGVAASPSGAAVVTTSGSIGLAPDGRVLWEDRGFPLPLVRDGRDVTLLVAPGSTTAAELRVVDAAGDDVALVDVPRGQHVALGGSVALSADGEEVVATPVDGGEGWAVTTPGEVQWVVLDGPTMVVLSSDGGRTTVTTWT